MKRHQLGMNCLGFYEEAVGTLSGLTIEQGFLNARISEVSLVLPPEMGCKLAPLMGTCIGILRTDIRGKEYLIRSISEKKALAIDEADVVGLTKSKEQREKAIA
jgi:hypothetical protein